MPPAIEVSDLVVEYGATRAVDGVSFAVREDEVFGLVGPNGAGKSTTLRTIVTLLSPTAGSVSVFGTDVTAEPAAVRERLAYLPEDAGSYENLTGRGFLRFVADVYADGDADRAAAMVDRGVEIAALGDRIDNKTGEYSKGMTRRLLVARTLMSEPAVAVMDEATAGLDVLNSREVREVIRDVPGDGRSVLLSSHDMREVESLCDRVALLNEGETVAVDEPDGLIERHGARDLEGAFVAAVTDGDEAIPRATDGGGPGVSGPGVDASADGGSPDADDGAGSGVER